MSTILNTNAQAKSNIHPSILGRQKDRTVKQQSPADKESSLLVSRIAQLEDEQQAALERIEQLNQAKLTVELTLDHLLSLKDKSEESKASSERLKKELEALVKNKVDEQDKLKERIGELKIRAKHDISLLQSERDAALALVEKQNDFESNKINEILTKHNKLLEYISMGILATLGLITLLLLILL